MWWSLCYAPQPLALLSGAMFAFRQSNAFGKLITFILFAGSIAVWTIMLSKGRELREARLMSARFLRGYRNASHPVLLYWKGTVKDEDGPLHSVYAYACQTLGAVLETDRPALDKFSKGQRFAISEHHLRAVRNAVDRVVADQALSLEGCMGMLATAATTAPFLGLLGTVWGVMDAFGSMSTGGSALLSDVAPGISGALLTTVVGLLVALPSSFGYNILSANVRRLVVQMDNFAQELVADLEQLQPDT